MNDFNLPLVILGLSVTGMGIGIALPGLQTIAVESIPVKHAGSASGIISTSRYFGSIVGSIAVAKFLARESQNDDKIKISLWDLPETDLSLEAVVSKWQFAERQVVLPLLDQLRSYCYTKRIEIPSLLAA